MRPLLLSLWASLAMAQLYPLQPGQKPVNWVNVAVDPTIGADCKSQEARINYLSGAAFVCKTTDTNGATGTWTQIQGASTSSLVRSGIGVNGLASANTLQGPANIIVATDGSGNGTSATAALIADILGTVPVQTATALAATPTPCTSGQFAQGVDASGNSIGCGAGGTVPAQPNNTITGNNSGSTSTPGPLTPAQTAALLGSNITYSQLGGTNPAAAGAALGATALQPGGNGSGLTGITSGQISGLGTIATLSATNTPLLGNPTIAGNPVTYATTPAATGDATFNVGSGVIAVSKIAGATPGTLFSQSPSASTEPQALPGGTVAPYSYLNPIVSTPITQSQTQVNATKIRVSDFGIYNDGTDHTTAMNNLMANAPAGSLIEFPCANSGGAYVFTGKLNFVGNHTYRGDITRSTSGCTISSSYGGGAGTGAAFNFLGADSVRLEDIRLIGTASGNPPEAVAMFGDITGSTGDHNSFDHVTIVGYATKALIYSIASEEQRWFDPGWYLLGGGALYEFYTADSDILGICSTCTGGSNTDFRFYGIHAVDSTALAGIAAGHCMAAFAATTGSTGDISFEGGYVATPGDENGGANAFATGFCFPTVIKGNVSVSNIRTEGAIYFANSLAAIQGLHFTFNTLAPSTAGTLNFLLASGGTLSGLVEIGNVVTGAGGQGTSISGLANSFIFEPFPAAVATAVTSLVINSTNGASQFSSNIQLVSGSQPTCDASHKGTIYDLQTSTPDQPMICNRLASGVMAWQNIVLSGVNVLASSATPAFNLALGTYQTNTLTANVTSSTATGLSTGSQSYFKLTENSTGGFTYVWPTNIKNVGPINTAPNAINVVGTSCFDTSNCYATGPVMDDSGNAYVKGSFIGSSGFSTAAVSLTPGTNITSVTCTSATCDVNGGSLSIVGGALASTGTFATVSYTAIATAPRVCQVTMNGGATFLGLGHGTPSTTSFTLTAAVSVAATTFALDYKCNP